TSIRREELERDGRLSRTDARRFGESEKLLQFDGGDDAAVVAVVEACGASARQRDRERREAVDVFLAAGECDAALKQGIDSAIRVDEFLRFDRIGFRWALEEQDRAVPRALRRFHF